MGEHDPPVTWLESESASLLRVVTGDCTHNDRQIYETLLTEINHQTRNKYKLLCPRGTQTCALAVANIAHAVREMLDVAKRPITQG